MWEYFKQRLIRVQEQQVPARMKDRYGMLREPWMTRDVMTLVKKKKEVYTAWFVWERSFLTNLIEFLEEVIKMFEGKVVDVVYMDFSKAFYRVSCSRLVQKVKSHGIRGAVKTSKIFQQL
eukprot:g47119.t1